MNIIKNIALLFLLLGGRAIVSAQTEFRLESSKNSSLSVMFRGSFYNARLDDNGYGRIVVPDSLKPDYATAYGDRKTYTFYLVPGQLQGVRETPDRVISFTGAGKDINEYLNSPELSSGVNFRMDETLFLDQWKARVSRFCKSFDSLSAQPDFKAIERKRLHYLACELLTRYMSYNEGPFKDDYYELLDSLMVEDPDAYELGVYRNSFLQWIDILGRKYEKAASPKERLMWRLGYVSDKIKDSRLAGCIVHQNVYEHVRRHGTQNIAEAIDVYSDMVTDPNQKADFEKLIGKSLKLTKGVKAPDFELPDIDGNMVSLSSLAGSWVYIDVWATWCGPCCREMGPLRELENKLKERPIRFVGISIDQDESAWREKVKSENLGGIQLRASGSAFERDYNVTFVPRFILIDADGCIVEANMTRPSQPETLSELESVR